MSVRREDLSALYQDATAEWAPGSAVCLDHETLERAARGRLKGGERPAVADHLVSCSECSRAVLALRALSSWARDAEAAVRAARRLRVVPFVRRPVTRIVALAAVLVIAAGLGAMWHASGRSTATTLRGVRQTGMAVEPVDGAVLGAAPDGNSRPHARAMVTTRTMR